MPSALPMEIRHQIAFQLNKADKLIDIAKCYNLSYSTVRGICKRYRHQGVEGLQPHYYNCGRNRPASRSSLIYRAALWLKRLHPYWGAALIVLKLKERYPKAVLPCERTLQRWFHAAGLYKTRSVFPVPLQPSWATGVHDIWQVDANEKLRLSAGQRACYLSVVDERSGSLLNAFVFPPFSDQ